VGGGGGTGGLLGAGKFASDRSNFETEGLESAVTVRRKVPIKYETERKRLWGTRGARQGVRSSRLKQKARPAAHQLEKKGRD